VSMVTFNRIVHLTSAHSRFDVRIFLKECRSLVGAGYEVSLVVADGFGNEVKDGVSIHDVGKPSGRIGRIFSTTRRVFDKAVMLDADIYHFHDPELMPVGLKLGKMGRKVVYDVHEDVSKQMLAKPYLNKPLRWVLAKIIAFYERWSCSSFDGVVAATPSIEENFIRVNDNVINVNNYPILGEFISVGFDWNEKKNEVCYVGCISLARGIEEVVSSMVILGGGCKLQLVGEFSELYLREKVRKMKGWSSVDELGFLGRRGVKETLDRSMAGLVTLHPTSNYVDSLPIKMFEYMSAGIPVIASDFPLWRQIIEDAKCGLLVDPMEPKSIADAIQWIFAHPEEAEIMGKCGQEAVKSDYNWDNEYKKMEVFYRSITE